MLDMQEQQSSAKKGEHTYLKYTAQQRLHR